jgi:hypothetical protein
MGRYEDLARRDTARVTGSPAGWGTLITFQSPDSPPVVASVYGRAAKHHTKFRDQGGYITGVSVNGKNASCGVSEQLLVAAGYTVRNAAKEVDMVGHQVSWVDSTGELKVYMVAETWPDETIGYVAFKVRDSE